MNPVIGTAGWSIARKDVSKFPDEGTSLERYSQVFSGMEVNSSFHRSHRPSTWARWASSVPADFRFAVKIPKAITHQRRLVDVDTLIEQFASEAGALGSKVSVALVQLPPKLTFDPLVVQRFFGRLRASIDAQIVCEPRNTSWFEQEADDMLEQLQVGRVAADPALSRPAALPGGWRGIAYWRLHGAPVVYRSSYSNDDVCGYAREMRTRVDQGIDTWCLFDNTASSAAVDNAFSLIRKL